MGNLILLNEVRNEKLKSVCDENVDKYVELTKIIKRLFMIKNNRPLIDLLNEIYDDNLEYNLNLKYENNINLNDFEDIVFLSDNNSVIDIINNDQKYRIQFEVRNDKQVSITILKYNIDDNRIKILDPYIIMISSEINICDIYKLKLIFNKKKLIYRARVFKSWQYNFKQLYENDMYLLYPLKVFELEKRLLELKKEVDTLEDNIQDFPKKTNILNLIKSESKEFFKNMNAYLKKMELKKILSEDDIKEFNIIAIDILKKVYPEISFMIADIEDELYEGMKQ